MIFKRVLVGFDGSEEALHSARLANRLRGPGAHLLVVTVAETHYALYAGLEASEWDRRVREAADEACDTARREFAGDYLAQARVVTGHVDRELLATASQFGADLLAVGASGLGRTTGIILGSVASRVIHDALCSVLVGRGELRAPLFPRHVTVGVDGSAQAEHARALAEALTSAAKADLRLLTAIGGKPLPDGPPADAELDRRHPVEALVDAARHSDLLVLGSRGLHGLASLGSVAERVAHEAACPVLIVRGSYGGDPEQHAVGAASSPVLPELAAW